MEEESRGDIERWLGQRDDLLVRGWMSEYVLMVRPEQSIGTVAHMMRNAQEDHVAVVTSSLHVLGVVTALDIVSRQVITRRDPDDVPVSDIMTPDPPTIRDDAAIVTAAERITYQRLEELLVVNAAGALVGRLTNYRLMQLRAAGGPRALRAARAQRD